MNFALELEKRDKSGKESQLPPSAISTTASECSTPISISLCKTFSKASLTDASLAKSLSKTSLTSVVSCGKENQIPQLPNSSTASECSTPVAASVPSLASLAKSSSKQTLTDARSIASLESDLSSIPGCEEKLSALRCELDDQKLSVLHKRAMAEGAESEELDEVLDSEQQREAYIRLILCKMHQKTLKRPGAMPLALRRVVASLIPKSDAIPEDLNFAVRASVETIHKFQGPRCQRKPTYSNYSPRRSPRRSPQRCCNQWID